MINFAEIPEGTGVSSSFLQKTMIDKHALTAYIEKELEGTDCFLTDLTIGADNNIRVEIDSDSVVDIDRCVELTRRIEEAFDRDEEDYELEVGSAGLTSPLRTERQYRKYIGEELEVSAADGRKYRGELTDVNADGITLLCREKVREEGMKRPDLRDVRHGFAWGDIRRAEYMIQF